MDLVNFVVIWPKSIEPNDLNQVEMKMIFLNECSKTNRQNVTDLVLTKIASFWNQRPIEEKGCFRQLVCATIS